MNWLDVAGPPGSGKSTLCDPLWGPHDLPIENRLPPAAWHDFLNEITRLFCLIDTHPILVESRRTLALYGSAQIRAIVQRVGSDPEAATPADMRIFNAYTWVKSLADVVRMVNRSVRKITTVARMSAFVPSIPEPERPPGMWSPDDDMRVLPDELARPYIQTALAQRGLGFGWRLNKLGVDLNELRHYFRLMPVSLGVAFTRCPQKIVEERNHARKLVPRTAHEDRAHMAALMQPAIELAIEVLRERGIPVVEVDTTQPVDQARARLVDAASGRSYYPEALGSGREMAPVLSPPPWWQ